MGNCYGRETWCHIDHQTGFINWLSRHIHKMKISNGMDNKFFLFWKTKLISISLIAYVFSKLFMFIVHCICSALSCRLLAQFCSQLPHGCFACCCLNMSFIHNPRQSPRLSLQSVLTWLTHEYQGTLPLIFGDVMCGGVWGKLHIIPVMILRTKVVLYQWLLIMSE